MVITMNINQTTLQKIRNKTLLSNKNIIKNQTKRFKQPSFFHLL